jgi:RNA polymerase sigma-70 factor (ECF subfamily)
MLAMAIAAIENDGDRSLVESLYTKYYALMLRKAQSMVRDRQSAEDVVEAVMLRLIERIDLLRGCNRASLRSYLVACVRNEAIDRLRRTGRIQPLDDAESQLGELPDDAPGAEIRLIREAQIQAVVRALEALDDRERLALRMKYYDRMTEGEIARLFGMSRSGIRNVIDRARRHVGAQLQEGEWI